MLRYPAPFQQTSDLLAVDLIIGQPDLNSSSSNGGQTAPTASTLALANYSGVFRAGLAFDAQGNLWVSDPGNNRVLRYPAASLHRAPQISRRPIWCWGRTISPRLPCPLISTRSGKNYLSQPSGLAFDPKGRLFIADSGNRVVVYAPPFAIGQASARVMGVVTTPNAPLVSESTLGAVDSNGHAVPPQAIFFIGNNPYVVDTGQRANPRLQSVRAMAGGERRVFAARADRSSGRLNFQGAQSNQGLAQPTAATFAGPQPNPFVAGPVDAVFDGIGTLYVVDSGNNRVLAFPQQPIGTFTIATRAAGAVRVSNTTRSTGLMAAKWASAATRDLAA